MITLVDLIFKGSFSVINFGFLEQLILQSRETRFNYPENASVKTFDDIMMIIKSNHYVDFIISLNFMAINDINTPDVFINIGREDEKIEMLLFFDMKDLNKDFSKGLDYLYNWSVFFKNKYNFGSFFCQIDGGGIDENDYYFKG
jgi:hypothetical protein